MSRIKFAAGCVMLLITATFSFGQSAQNPPPTLPTIATANIFNVTNSTYGASTNSANNATAIQKAITAAAAASGGGTVEIPGPGTYLCGPLTLKSKVNFQVDAGATLMMLAYSNSASTTTFISGSSISDVEISGSGTIDGQGAAWWAAFNSSGVSRPNFIQFSSCNRILIRDITLQNPPTFHIMIKNNNANITVTNLTINTPYPSPNTDGFDVASTNVLIENSYISDGDDNVEIGGSQTCAEVTITNCTFGRGHGVSMGSITSGGVSNIMVVNCTFSQTDNAIRMKSDVGNGGVVQNLSYYNIGMTNIKYAPILIYSYYTDYGNPTTAGISPTVAAAMTVSAVGKTTPIWRNIIISNLTATAGQPGMIWGLLEMPATNITLAKVSVTAAGSFDLYNVKGLKIIDSQVHITSGNIMYELLNVQATFTNSTTGAPAFMVDGITGTNSLAFYNQTVNLNNSNFFGATPITLAATKATDLAALTLPGTTPVNFGLGTNPATFAIYGNLTTSSTLNISDAGGFGPGTYTLFSYSGALSGTPVLGTKPSGYNYNLDTTSTAGQVNLVVTSTNTSGAPAITSPPAAQSVVQGNNATFTVGASGNAPLVYQWYFNTTNSLVNATNTAYTITNAQPANAGLYSVVVTNASGAVTSTPVALTVGIPPSITNSPAGQSVLATSNATFTVGAAGSQPLLYQWWFNSTNRVNGATNSILTLTNVQAASAGSYTVIITNLYGTVTSTPAALVVHFPPFITNQPAGQSVILGSNVTFTVGAGGDATLAYQWWFNATNPLAGGTAAALTLTNIQGTNAGGYTVIVTNNYGMVTSAVAKLTVTTNNIRLLVTLPGQTYTSGGGNSGAITPQAAGIPFNITLTAVGNDGVTVNPVYNGTNTITFAGPGGSPVYPAHVVFTNGQATNVSITLTLAQTTTLSAADNVNGYTGIISSNLLVNPGTINAYVVTAGTAQSAGAAFNVTVTAKDAYLNTVTNDSSTSVTLSAMGSATATVNPMTLTAGMATFSVTDNTAETITITATDSNSKTGTSPAITISVNTLPFYRSTASGNWNTASTWESSLDGGATWTAAAAPPEMGGINAGMVYITNNAASGTAVSVTNTSVVTVSNVVVYTGNTLAAAGATLIVSSNGGTTNLDVFGTLLVANSGLSGVTNAGAAGNVTFENGGLFLLETTTNAAIPAAAWNAGSTCEYAPLTAGTNAPRGLGQTFGNFIWNWPAQSGSAILYGALTNVQGNIDVTAGSAFCFGPKPDTTSTTGTLTVGGSINVHQMGGNLLLGAGGTEAGTYLVQVGKGIIVDSNGRLDVGNNGAAHTGSVTVEFTGNSQFTLNGVAIGNPEGGAYLVDAGHTLTLNSPVVLGRTFTVNGTLNFNTNQLTGYTNSGGLLCNGTLLGSGTNQLTAGLSNIVYGGTLNLGPLPALAAGQSFVLFGAATYNTNSAFSGLVPATPGPGLAWNTSALTVNGTLGIAAAGGVIAISNAGLAGTNFVFSGNAGIANGTYSVLASTNMQLPLPSWTVLATNLPLDAGGNFSYTVSNAPAANGPQHFYLIKIP